MLQEVQRGMPSLYVYASPSSYEPLARIDGRPGQEDIQYFHTNLAGLPEQLTDEQGHTLWRSDYHGWGNTRDEWHSLRQGREQNLRYQGQYLDREIGLHYNTFRYFDYHIGNYTQTDPAGLKGGINFYSYAANPLLWLDPLGLSPLLPGEGQAGPFGKLPGYPGDNLTGHHMPSAAYMKKKFGISTNHSIAMQMEHSYPDNKGRHTLTRTFRNRPYLFESPRDTLARDIWDARKIYKSQGLYNTAIQEGLRNTILFNKIRFPEIFKKTTQETMPCPL